MIGGLFIFSKKYLNLNDFEKSMFLSIFNKFLIKFLMPSMVLQYQIHITLITLFILGFDNNIGAVLFKLHFNLTMSA